MIENVRIALGELPTSYLESMTYAEMLTWMCNYLDDTVGTKINEMIEKINDLEDDYTSLHQYVDEQVAGCLTNAKNYTDSKILELKNYVDGLIGDINSALDTINGEVI